MTKLGRCLLGVVLVALAYSCGSSNAKRSELGDGGAGGEAAAGAPPRPVDGGAAGEASAVPVAGAGPGGAGGSPDQGSSGEGGATGGAGGAGGAAGEVSVGGEGGAAVVVLPEGTIVNVPYTCDSPFDHVNFPSYFYLETFEDHLLNEPGVTAPNSQLSSSLSQAVVDSIDCDDGVIDEACTNCEAMFGNGSIELLFDEAVLGELPSHVGLVWTDGGANSSVTITGYDTENVVIYSEQVAGIGDAVVTGTTAEDRFFGIVSFEGVKRVVILNSTGGVEIDHLQYGR